MMSSQNAVDWIYFMFDLDFSFYDIRDVAVEYCEREETGRIDIKCPSLADAYGPHVSNA